MATRVPMPTFFSYLAFFFIAIQVMVPMSSASLDVGFYQYTCPTAESIVRQAVSKAMAQNPGIGAALIRMHFHDCFVRGCDASVLLDPTPGNPSEKMSPINNPSLRGFEVIDKAKAMIEACCPSTVSCADIIAFAARDAAYLAGGINYLVPSGRRDGRVSIESEVVKNNPFPSFNAEQLKDNFARKGLSVDEMVTLSGAHSIGRSLCSSFSIRLYNFSSTNSQDPSMDPTFAAYLKTKCPPPSTVNGDGPRVSLDIKTPNRLDNQYYKNLMKHRGILTSDQALQTSQLTAELVRGNVNNPYGWWEKYAAAMVHMGSIEVLTGSQGEIRKKCMVVNQ